MLDVAAGADERNVALQTQCAGLQILGRIGRGERVFHDTIGVLVAAEAHEHLSLIEPILRVAGLNVNRLLDCGERFRWLAERGENFGADKMPAVVFRIA